MNAVDYLRSTCAGYDLIICYGMLHVLSEGDVASVLSGFEQALKTGGTLILQYLTNKFPAPRDQPELDHVWIAGCVIEPEPLALPVPQQRRAQEPAAHRRDLSHSSLPSSHRIYSPQPPTACMSTAGSRKSAPTMAAPPSGHRSALMRNMRQ